MARTSESSLLRRVGRAAASLWSVTDVPAAIGARATGEAAQRVERSPQWREGRFHNTVPSTTLPPGSGKGMLREVLRRDQRRKPAQPIPVITPDATPVTGGVHLTWYGHASVLVEIEGHRVLFDPVWSERCSPTRLVGPRRLHSAPLPLADVPALDAVVISHDHYDHLDMDTVIELTRRQAMPFVVPLGIGAHLRRWGVPETRIIELDWDEPAQVGALRLVATAARHFSGRGLTRDRTLWASWVVAGPTRRVFYTGDTGYFDGFARIGAEHGPFDASLVQCGAYGDQWPDIHMTPEDAVSAHVDVHGGLLVPVHWCTFVLAFHPWSDPVERLWREAKAREVPLAVPRPGQRVDVDNPPEVDDWWSTIA